MCKKGLIFAQKVGIISYYETFKKRSGSDCEACLASADPYFQGRNSCRNADKHGCRRFKAYNFHGQKGQQDALFVCPTVGVDQSRAAGKELEGGSRNSSGDERFLARRNGGLGKFVEGFYIKDCGRPGRPAKANPKEEDVLKALIGFLLYFQKGLNEFFSGIEGKGRAGNVLYTNETLIWAFLLGLFLRYESRNRMDARRNDNSYVKAIFALSGQSWWVRGSAVTTPCTESCCNFLKQEGLTESLEEALLWVVKKLLKNKCLENARLRGCIVIAVDATKQETLRKLPHKDRDKEGRISRYVLEAKIITPWGWALSVMSEPVRPWHNENEKQDCEYNAFLRLAPRLKKAFPKLGICIVGDALYACSPIMHMCEKYKWNYILTFKEGRSRAAYAEAQRLMEMSPDKGSGDIAWAQDVTIDNDLGEATSFNVVRIKKRKMKGSNRLTYSGQFATNFEVETKERAREITQWGRRRWNIETSFNVEKHHGFGLGHTFCTDARASRNIYLLMQIANNLWQVFSSGHMVRLSKKYRKVTCIEWVYIIREALHRIGIIEDLNNTSRRYMSRILLVA